MKKIINKIIIINILIIQICMLGAFNTKVKAIENIKKGEKLPDYFQYYDEKENSWKEYSGNIKYKAQNKKIVFTMQNNYNLIKKWKILEQGYNGKNYKEWNLKNDAELYLATKIALESIEKNVTPLKWIKQIDEKGEKILKVAEKIYQAGEKEIMGYSGPSISIIEQGESKKILKGEEHYIQKFNISSKKEIVKYEIILNNFTNNTKILNENMQLIKKQEEKYKMQERNFYIAIPIKEIKENISGTIDIKNAMVKTCPIAIESNGNNFTIICENKYEFINKSKDVDILKKQYGLTIYTYGDLSKNEVISNVEYEITNDKGEYIGTYISDEKGKIIINNLEDSIIYLEQIEVPESYSIIKGKEKIELKWGEMVEKEMWNIKKKGKIRIHIKDEKAQNLENYLVMYNKDGKEISAGVTDNNGIIEFLCYGLGTYYIKGLTPKDLNGKTITVNLQKDGQVIEIEFNKKTNEENKQEIQNNQENEEENKLEVQNNQQNYENNKQEIHINNENRDEIKKLPRTGF